MNEIQNLQFNYFQIFLTKFLQNDKATTANLKKKRYDKFPTLQYSSNKVIRVKILGVSENCIPL